MIQKCSKWRVLKVFLENPEKKQQIRGISRKISLAATSVKLHLNELIKNKLVFEKKDDIFKYYKANFDSPLFRFYKKINNLININESGLVEFLDERFSPNSVIIFGSYANGYDISRSDIDIFVQAKEMPINLKKFESKLSRKIQLFFAENINDLPKELANNILNGVKLAGYLKVFYELDKNGFNKNNAGQRKGKKPRKTKQIKA